MNESLARRCNALPPSPSPHYVKRYSVGLSARRKLEKGGNANDKKPIQLSDYLELGLRITNLTETERKVVEDQLKKALYPKNKK